MAYCTLTDLLLNFGEGELEQVADRDRDGLADDGVLSDCMTFADDLIDGYLRERYTLPLVSVPRNLVGVACDIARYRLYQAQPTDLVVHRYEAAIQWLRDVSDGRVGLDVAATDVDLPRMAYSTPSSIFTDLAW